MTFLGPFPRSEHFNYSSIGTFFLQLQSWISLAVLSMPRAKRPTQAKSQYGQGTCSLWRVKYWVWAVVPESLNFATISILEINQTIKRKLYMQWPFSKNKIKINEASPSVTQYLVPSHRTYNMYGYWNTFFELSLPVYWWPLYWWPAWQMNLFWKIIKMHLS